MKPSAALQTYRDQIRQLAASRGFEGIVVFGSTARGEDRESSDLDLMIRLPDYSRFFDAYDLIGQINAVCRGARIDAVVDEMIKPEIRATALSEGFLL